MKVIKSAKPKVDEVRKPECPRHNVEMVYEPALGRWTCSEKGCKFTAKRKQRDDDDDKVVIPAVKAVMPREPKMSYRADKDVELVIVETEGLETRYAIVARGENNEGFFINVTDYVETVIDDQTNDVTLCLLFHNVQRVGEI